jgi:hypothetical protein
VISLVVGEALWKAPQMRPFGLQVSQHRHADLIPEKKFPATFSAAFTIS